MGSNNSIVPNSEVLNFENYRRITLEFFPAKFASKERFACAGFYYTFQSDYVKCKFCEVVISDWGVGDDPFVEHMIQSPNCPLINNWPTDNMATSQKKLNHELQLLSHNRNIRHPHFQNYADRLKSFENWSPNLKPCPEKLSTVGFFYLNVDDHVKCFSCGGCLKNWKENDQPLDEHLNHFGHCKFIQNTFKKNEKMFWLI